MRPIVIQLGWMLLVTGAYLVAGKLALLMAIPPGYATAVWPAAGVAVVAVLRGGYRLAPAVALGSFLVNLPTSLDPTATAVAASLGVGAALQATAATLLIRRKVGHPNALERTGDVIRFMVFAGPLACVVGATWGVTTLFAVGAISRATLAVSWSTWWVGDTIGVLIFAPFLLAFVGEPRAAWRRRRVSVVLPLLVGFLVVTAIFLKASGWERDRTHAEFGRRADELTRAVQRQAEIYVDVDVAVASLHQASIVVTGDELEAFARPLMARNPAVLAVSWIAWVTGADRSEYERGERIILEQDPSGALVRAADRPDYFPIHEIAPFEASRGVVGFDLGSEQIRRSAMERARDSGEATATAPIELVQDRARQPGVLFLVPVYRSGAPSATIEQRRRNLIGFASTVVRTAEIVDVALQGLDRSGVHIRLLDGDEGVLYDDGVAGAATERGMASTFAVAGRWWRVEVVPTDALLQAQRGWQAWLVLAGGLLFVSLLGAILLIVTGNEIRSVDAEARYRDLYDQSPDLYVSVSADTGVVLDCNQTVVFALGRNRETIVGRPVLDIYAPQCHDAVRSAFVVFRETGEVRGAELQLRRGDGTPLDVSLSVTAVRDQDGRIVRSRSVWRDISVRKQLDRDDALRLSLGDSLRSMEDVGSIAGLVASQVGEHLSVARCFVGEVDVEDETMVVHRDFHHGVPSIEGTLSLGGFSRDTQAELRAGRTIIVGDAAIDPRTAERYATGYAPLGFRALLGVPMVRAGRWVASLWAVDGEPRAWASREVVLLQTIAERMWVWIEHARMLGQLRELNTSLEERVADRTRALETSVREKDVLLREVHHRVKNNLQVISSLLNLQAMSSDDPNLKHALAESRDRIHSLALVHDQLYQAANAATIELDRYLRELVSSIEQTHRSSRVRIAIEASACSLPLDQAVPCGLIVNELITNALKHAFPEGREGNITVVAAPGPDADLRLAVRDDGVGLPAGFDLAAGTGLGMLIVDTLSRQLGAALSINRDGGTTFELRIPLASPE